MDRYASRIKNAAGCFQRAMGQTFQGHESKILPPYYDDVVIKGKTFNEHLDNVRVILNDVCKAGSTLNALKCDFFQHEVLYLGHRIKDGNVSVDPNRITTITSLTPPTNVSELRRIIGMTQFCSRFIPHLNIVLSSLYHLLEKDVSFKWSPECTRAFEHVKTLLTTAPVLTSPSKDDQFILETDACNLGAGSCLKIVRPDGNEHVVAFHSYKFNKTERNWNIVEKEAFSVVLATRTYRHYLIGSQFTIRVDNQIITYINTKREPKNRKLLNWALELSEFDYQIIHIAGKTNTIGDCLSRVPKSDCDKLTTVTYQMTDMSLDDWLTAQHNDTEIQACLKHLEQDRKLM